MLPSLKKDGQIALHMSVGSPSPTTESLTNAPLPFKVLKGAAVKLLACRTRGPSINPGFDPSNSVIVYLLFLFLISRFALHLLDSEDAQRSI